MHMGMKQHLINNNRTEKSGTGLHGAFSVCVCVWVWVWVCNVCVSLPVVCFFVFAGCGCSCGSFSVTGGHGSFGSQSE